MPRQCRGAAAHGAGAGGCSVPYKQSWGHRLQDKTLHFSCLGGQHLKHLNLALKARCITELEPHLRGEYGALALKSDEVLGLFLTEGIYETLCVPY